MGIERCRKLLKIQNLRPDCSDICCSFLYLKYTQMLSVLDPTRSLVSFHFGTTTVFTCVIENIGLLCDVRYDIHATNDTPRVNYYTHNLTENLHFYTYKNVMFQHTPAIAITAEQSMGQLLP